MNLNERLLYLEEQLEHLEDLLFKGIKESTRYRKACYMYSQLIDERNRVLEQC